MNRKRPFLAACLNFLWPGVGYLYVGRRVGFAVMLFIAELLLLLAVVTADWSGPGGLFYAGSLLAGLAFATDAWNEAKIVNRGFGTGD